MYNESHLKTDDNKLIFIREWIPEKDPKAIILYVHGLGSHSGRLEPWAKRFNQQGIAFIAHDHRGHGKSDEKRGQPKKFSYLVRDTKLMMKRLREQFPEKKIILYGHSLGGNIAINYVISETFTADALIVTSPWLKLVAPPSKLLFFMINFLDKVLPGLTFSNRLNADDISRDEQAVEAYRQDPLVHDQISAGLFKSAYEGGLHALRNVYKINCPFLIMHGNADKITSHKSSENFVMNTSDRTHLKIWEGAYHELHNEPEK
jgi:alpha-beta hydrolase superfamily lysophospholipase